MPFDRFLIAPYKTGLETDEKSWLLTEDAFVELQNAYVFRGRVRKRFGTKMMGTTQLATRLRVQVDTSDGGGSSSGTVPGAVGALGQMFSIGNEIFTVWQASGAMLDTGSASTATFNISTGVFVFTGVADLTPVYWYPSLPVMGLTQYESGAVNNHPSYAFDTRFAYEYVAGTGWVREGTGTTPMWHGNDLNFFWTTNWQGTSTSSNSGIPVLFASNFNAALGAGKPTAADDPIWYTFTPTTSNWTALSGTLASTNGFFFLPIYGSPPVPQAPYTGSFVQTSKIIVPFKNRLILLNTIENNNTSHTGTGTATAYTNRCRYSWKGSPFAVNAWYEYGQSDSSGNAAAGGGFIDASTEEQIISAEFIKDRLIVYFERSTWELAYTGNEITPFVWQKINTELGSQSTFSTVPFDQAVLTVGQSGIHSCNGANVARIDDKIPDEIFEFETENNATQRTVGIRDYFTELVYWTYSTIFESGTTQTYPNQILVYNYRNGTWARNDDSFTMFGYFEQQQDTTWESSAPVIWEQSGDTWISGVQQANQRVILAGNQEGFVLIIDSAGTSGEGESRNAPSLQITNMSIASTGIVTLTVYKHNLRASPTAQSYDQDFILIENINSTADPITAAALNNKIFVVNTVIDANTITINTKGTLTAGTYSGGGTIARVSNPQLTTVRFNPYIKENKNVYIEKIDFAVLKTTSGEITVDYFPSSSPVSMIAGGYASGSITGTSVLETFPYAITLYPLEQDQDLLWHALYFQTSGQFIKFALYLTQDQMINYNIATSPFELEGMAIYSCKVGRVQ